MRAPPFDREIIPECCVQIAHHGAAARLRDLLWVAGDESDEPKIAARAHLDASVRSDLHDAIGLARLVRQPLIGRVFVQQAAACADDAEAAAELAVQEAEAADSLAAKAAIEGAAAASEVAKLTEDLEEFIKNS